MPRRNTEADFWRFVDKTRGECWLWIGKTKSNRRYGQFNEGGKHHRAHRYSYELHVGLIPEGLEVLHSCDNGLCVNPAHLSVGTHLENMQDMARKGRKKGVKGEKSHLSKLTELHVLSIRAFHAQGMTQGDIAEKFGMHQTSIGSIVNRKTWKHI